MKHLITVLLKLTLLTSNSYSDGLDRLEIWGWNGGKKEFRDLYYDKTGVDLNNGNACEADLIKMGFKNAMSIIYIDDLQAFRTGKINLAETDRLVIIREFTDSRFSTLLKDTVLQNRIDQIIEKLKIHPELLNEKSAYYEFSNFELLLLGTINSMNSRLRHNCNSLIRELGIENIEYRDNTSELLTIMLSTPDPDTCYNAMAIIGHLKENQQINVSLDFRNALTLKEFVSSDLRTFQPDAIRFLTTLYPDRDYWTVKNWKEWFDEK